MKTLTAADEPGPRRSDRWCATVCSGGGSAVTYSGGSAATAGIVSITVGVATPNAPAEPKQ